MKTIIQDHPPIALSNPIANAFIDAFECGSQDVIAHCQESFLGRYNSKEDFAQEFWDELKEEDMIDDLNQSLDDFTIEIFELLFKYKDNYIFCDNW